MKYYGEWSTGNTYTSTPYESTNKNQLIKLMTKLAYDNCAGVDRCHWSVWRIDEEGNKQLIAEGGRPYGGRKWRENYE